MCVCVCADLRRSGDSQLLTFLVLSVFVRPRVCLLSRADVERANCYYYWLAVRHAAHLVRFIMKRQIRMNDGGREGKRDG